MKTFRVMVEQITYTPHFKTFRAESAADAERLAQLEVDAMTIKQTLPALGWAEGDRSEEYEVRPDVTEDISRPISILDMRPTAYDAANRRSTYNFTHSLPNVATTTTARQTPEEAYQDAEEWCAGYRSANTVGNFAHPLGAAVHRAGYVGVYEYYHSNS